VSRRTVISKQGDMKLTTLFAQKRLTTLCLHVWYRRSNLKENSTEFIVAPSDQSMWEHPLAQIDPRKPP
jgi:hypothetical protein